MLVCRSTLYRTCRSSWLKEGGGAQTDTERGRVVVAGYSRTSSWSRLISSRIDQIDHPKIDCMHLCIYEYLLCQVALVHLCCSEREMKRCASDMSEDDSTGNVVLPDGGGKKAVSLPSTVALTTERELQFNASFPGLNFPIPLVPLQLTSASFDFFLSLPE